MWLWLGWSVASAFGAQRFPPPEFETDYVMPVTATPAPRSLAMQYVDVAVLAGALAVATWLAIRRRSRRGLIGLSVFSLVYFGFYRTGCICPIGSPQNVALGLFDPAYAVPLTAAAFFVLPLVVALFAGRSFCAGVCPQGALQDLVLIRPIKVPAWLENALGIFPYVFLGLGVLLAATGSTFLFCRYDPFVPLFRLSGNVLMVSVGLGLLILGMFVGRPYCRFICPYGALLRITSAVSRWRVRITPNYCT
ncbi:MAG: 4Fe-4S binding protein, partial [Verrucomicrobiae bacterium]|nr:4Fe-4S binding protein [Verrucomicrobiae bacterium]